MKLTKCIMAGLLLISGFNFMFAGEERDKTTEKLSNVSVPHVPSVLAQTQEIGISTTSVSETAYAGKTVRQFIAEIRTIKPKEKPLHEFAIANFKKTKLKTPEGVEELISIIHANDKDRESAISLLNGLAIDEKDKQLEKTFINTLNDKDKDVQSVAIVNVGTLKSKAAASKLREILSGFNGVVYKARLLVDSVGARWTLLGPCMAAKSLGQIGDEEAIPLLKEEITEQDLGACAAGGLALMGKKVIPELVELIKKEKGKKYGYYARWAIADIRDKEAKHDLMEIMRNEKDSAVRTGIKDALISKEMYDDEVIKFMRDMYEKEKDTFFITGLQKQKDFLIYVFRNDTRSRARELALAYLGQLYDPTLIPVFEEAVKDRNLNIRERAFDALLEAGNKDVFIHLKDYLINNAGKVTNPETEKFFMRLVNQRLKSGQTGRLSLQETYPDGATEQQRLLKR